MGTPSNGFIRSTCRSHGNDPSRLLDIALAVQQRNACVDDDAIDEIADALSLPRIDVAGLVSFYAFLSRKTKGRIVIRLCDDVIDEMKDSKAVADALVDELGIAFGETTTDGMFTLERTSCIGMSDQAPAALFNDVVVPRLGPASARRVVCALREVTPDPAVDPAGTLARDYGDGNNSHDLVRSAVHNNLRLAGEVIFDRMQPGAALSRVLTMSPAEVIREIKTSRLRGRGGAGFPTGMKWEFTRAADADRRFLICNADEGEPGTFKDRVILTERPDLVFEGMTVAGYAVGAAEGLLYLRAEYAYLRTFLEHVLVRRRELGLLGGGICGKRGFDFDIRIQLGAGAYICGEETALINSAEGARGEPRNRPPFPARQGYLGKPTSVNNVETLCCAARIIERGSGWFSAMGTAGSTGTKLLSVSGDCRRPGVYEVPYGITLREVFDLCGSEEPSAAQIGGPSGQLVGNEAFERTICFDDLSTGGALTVFGAERDPLWIASRYLEFFVHESCGFCTPCRVGNTLMKETIDAIRAGRCGRDVLAELEELARTVKTTSRCGLGQTSPHPVLSTLENFRPAYERLLRTDSDDGRPAFDLERSLTEARTLQERP